MGSHDWLIFDRSTDGQVVGGVVFDHGAIDEGPDELGATTLSLAILRQVLLQPAEDPGLAPLAGVAFDVRLRTSSIVVGGDPTAVARALSAIPAHLAALDLDDLDDARTRAQAAFVFALPDNADARARWGPVGPALCTFPPFAIATLAAPDLQAFARRAFSTSRRLFLTNHDDVATFTDPAPDHDVADAHPQLVPPPVNPRPVAFQADRGSNLVTFSWIGPDGPAGHLMATIVDRRLRTRLVDMEPIASALDVRREPLGGDALWCARILAISDPGRVVVAAEELLADLARNGATQLERDQAARTFEVATAAGGIGSYVAFAAARLLDGDRRSYESDVASVHDVDSDALRDVCEAANATLVVGVPPDTDTGPYPLITPTPIPSPAGDTFRTHAVPDAAGASQTKTPAFVRCDGTTLTWVQQTATKAFTPRRPVAVNGVELRDVAVRVDFGDVQTMLFDHRTAVVSLPWGELDKPEKLRALVDGATTGALRINAPTDQSLAETQQRVTRAKWSVRKRIALIVGVGAVAIAIIALLPRSDSGRGAAPITATIGEPVELDNGQSVNVIEIIDVPAAGEVTFPAPQAGDLVTLLDVEMCLEPSSDRNAVAPESVSEQRFGVTLDDNREAVIAPNLTTRSSLGTATLAVGDCRRGWIGFLHGPEQTPIRASYLPLDQPEVRWPIDG